MRFNRRDKALTVCRAMRSEKVLIVLDWLCEFRMSNAEILSSRLEISITNAFKLLADMQSSRMILAFENVHTRGMRLFGLAEGGVRHLSAWGRDTQKAVVKASNLARSTTVIHDLCVQRITLHLAEKFKCVEVIWDLNIKTTRSLRPDAILVTADQYVAALEFDRTAKNLPQFFERLVNSYEAIRDNEFNALFIAVESSAVMKRYQALFDQEEWPVYRKNEKGNLVELSTKLTPERRFKNEIRWLPTKDVISSILSSRVSPKSKLPKIATSNQFEAANL
ncbi:MAG: hypothetical protein EOP10_30040 [Proteobacteria bacterium]|nr:MAG: hypothetical protein EOP10_30040 [Pseudomonadota bacterium]